MTESKQRDIQRTAQELLDALEDAPELTESYIREVGEQEAQCLFLILRLLAKGPPPTEVH